MLKFWWLGAPRIDCDDQSLHFPTRKAMALLAYLGCTNQPVSRDKLATLFWAEYDQTRASANLRRTLVSIHQTLGENPLVSNREMIGLNTQLLLWSDINEFHRLITNVNGHTHQGTLCEDCIEQLEKALALYRGDFLEGFYLKDCSDFDDWQHLQKESVRADLGDILYKLSAVYMEWEEWEKALLIGRQWVNLDRLNELAQRRLMLALAYSGQRSAAIRQYEECKHELELELGQSPEQETVALYQRIKTGSFEKGGVSHQPTKSSLQDLPGQHPLIRTKMYIPHRPSGMVSRQHLIDKLEQGAQRALTLISAPAGYGKTTLLSEWVEILQKRNGPPHWKVCWISLGAEDNDPVRFLSYLSAALGKIHPDKNIKPDRDFHTTEVIQPETPLSILLNDFQPHDPSLLLVLDDYQFISSPAIHDGINFLLEHIPEKVHIVLITRSDPPFPLARLRARNQMTEIRASDLRFSVLEINQFLNHVYQLELTPEQIEVLETRTEGWIAGLQLAAISMQGRIDLAHFIEGFSGSQKFIMDYLTEEALNRLPGKTQAFLLQTSILERLSDPLCEFVLGQTDQAVSAPFLKVDETNFRNGPKSRLAELERSNLFIVPLDDERKWYRYHHLFADLLKSRLEQAYPHLVTLLHHRASDWFEKNGDIEEAIYHSLASRDWDHSNRLITQHLRSYLEKGQMTTVMKWIRDFPNQELYRYPMLSLQVAEVFSQAGMIDQIGPLLDAAETGIRQSEQQKEIAVKEPTLRLSAQEITSIRAMSAILRGLKAVCAHHPQQALTITEAVRSEIPEMEIKELAILLWVQGWAYRSLGNLPLALSTLTRATDYARKSGAELRDIWTDLGNVTRLTGRLTQAADIFLRSLQIAAIRRIPDQGNLSRDETFLSVIYFQQNRLEAAFSYATRALEHTQWWPSHNVIALAQTCLARIFLARNDPESARQALQKADQARENRLMTPYVHRFVETTWVQLWLEESDWDRLNGWVEQTAPSFHTMRTTNEMIDEYSEMRLIMLAKVWIEKTRRGHIPGPRQDVLQLLERLESNSQTVGRVNSLVYILFLKAICLYISSDTTEALRVLDSCFDFAQPGGYMRIFLDEEESARGLIDIYLHQANSGHIFFAQQIFNNFSYVTPVNKQIAGSPELLTTREHEILMLLAGGYSNRQIAEKLILSVGTVKFHVHHVLAKLKVESRTQAILRAKELELIS